MNPSLLASMRSWNRGKADEIAFWDNWVATRGGRWPEEFEQRLNANQELDGIVRRFIANKGFQNPSIIEVGSGPLTALGKVVEGRRIKLIPTDPLAPFYNEILEKRKISAPVTTIQAFAEDLSSYFDGESFDVAYCRNALDHSFDPLAGLWEMLHLVKLGGGIVLEHWRNEAVNENYKGFHQWNFDSENGKFLIWNKEQRHDLGAVFAAYADVSCELKNNVVVVEIEKKAGCGDRIVNKRQRVRELLDVLLNL